MIHKLTQVGSSVGITIPKKLLELFDWKQGEEVLIEPDVEHGTIVIKHIPSVKGEVRKEVKEVSKEVIKTYTPALKKLANR